ncbi:hypothetical protein DBR42_17635 [Pelomonas sp. HMWF004]|nr:hypothetical protein DBR42_17635 [Pelomonas sp. HMWF004]
MSRRIHPSLACWPGLTHWEAAERAIAGAHEPLWGELDASRVQIVPQGRDVFDVAMAWAFRARWPEVRFRLHANVRVLQPRRLVDLVDFNANADWFNRAAQVHRALGADVYSAHAGRRSHGSLADVLDAARRCADLFGSPVAVEGHYPVSDAAGFSPHAGPSSDVYLLSTWSEHAELLASGLPFVVDLSHLNIIATQSRCRENGLVRELLASEACLEVHLSDNDGRRDSHGICSSAPWWHGLLPHINPCAAVFTEGNHLKSQRSLS